MELATCEVRLNGDLLNTVIKDNVTPAELLILRSIHGAESVVRIVVKGMNRRQFATELDRLRKTYDRPTENVLLVASVFPGNAAALPSTFKEIGVTDSEEAEEVDTEALSEAEEVTVIKSPKKPKKVPLVEVLDTSDYDAAKDY